MADRTVDGARQPPTCRSRHRRRDLAAIAAVVAIVAAAAAPPVAAQQGDDAVRIVAFKLPEGRIESGLQQRQDDDTWGDLRLPRVRFFPTTAAVGRWLATSALTVGDDEVRIVARKLPEGRIEFGLQLRQDDSTWGDLRLPRVRFFPTTAAVGRWLATSALTVGDDDVDVSPTTTRYSAVSVGGYHSCGLRSDGSIICWGDNNSGQAEVPAGQYTAVSAGGVHSCGLRSNGVLACWSGNRYGRVDVPTG